MSHEKIKKTELTQDDLREIAEKLNLRHKDLVGHLHEHDQMTTEQLPPDSKDSLQMRQDIEIIESEEAIEEKEIKLIKNALQRIGNGNYGYCLSCGDPVRVERLKAVPETLYCIPCQEAKEKADKEAAS